MSLNPRIHYWQGRRVWLVGASSGIGEACAHALHARGAPVLVSARDAAALEAFAARHGGSHPAQAWPLDVTDPGAVTATARCALTRLSAARRVCAATMPSSRRASAGQC